MNSSGSTSGTGTPYVHVLQRRRRAARRSARRSPGWGGPQQLLPLGNSQRARPAGPRAWPPAGPRPGPADPAARWRAHERHRDQRVDQPGPGVEDRRQRRSGQQRRRRRRHVIRRCLRETGLRTRHRSPVSPWPPARAAGPPWVRRARATRSRRDRGPGPGGRLRRVIARPRRPSRPAPPAGEALRAAGRLRPERRQPGAVVDADHPPAALQQGERGGAVRLVRLGPGLRRQVEPGGAVEQERRRRSAPLPRSPAEQLRLGRWSACRTGR